MSKTDNPNAGRLYVPFIDQDDDLKYYIKVRTARGEWAILSRGYWLRRDAAKELRRIQYEMYKAYAERKE